MPTRTTGRSRAVAGRAQRIPIARNTTNLVLASQPCLFKNCLLIAPSLSLSRDRSVGCGYLIRPLSKSHTTAAISSSALCEQDIALVPRRSGLYNGVAISGTCSHLVPFLVLTTISVLA